MTNLEYCNEILSIIGNVTETNDAIYKLAYDAYQKLGGQESQPSLATIYNELKGAIQIWDNTDNLNITENGTYNLLGKIITVNVQGGGSVPSDEIWYTSSDGNIVTPTTTRSLPEIDTNTYSDGKGVIKFKTDVTSIGEWAFQNCTGLTSITIPNSVTSFGRYAFSGCSGLTSITIPNSITSIGSYAFSGCSKLSSIEILNNVTSIGQCAFEYCSGLSSVTIGNSVTSIGMTAFDGCTGLTSISYTGTIAQWNSVSKGLQWHRNVPATVVHCTDGDVVI